MSSNLDTELDKPSLPKKRGPGKPKPATLDSQLETFKEYKDKILTSAKTLKPRTDPIFVEIAGKIGNMSAAAVHLAIKRRMNEIFEDFSLPQNLQSNTPKEEESDDSVIDLHEYDDTKITVKLTDDERSSLQIIRKHYEESYLRLAPGWPDTLFSILKRLNMGHIIWHHAHLTSIELI